MCKACNAYDKALGAAYDYADAGAPNGPKTFYSAETGARVAVVYQNDGRPIVRRCWGGIDHYGDDYRLLNCAGEFQD